MKFTIRTFRDYDNIDHDIPKLVIPPDCCNEKEMKELVLTNFPNLRSVEIGDGSCKKVSEVIVYEMDNMVDLKFGSNSFKKMSGGFKVSSCPCLENLVIGHSSFSMYDACELEGI